MIPPPRANRGKRKGSEEDHSSGPAPKKAAPAKKAVAAPKKGAATKKGAAAVKAAVTARKPAAAAPKKAAARPAVAAPKAAKKPAAAKAIPQINFAPSQSLDVFVFGEGSAGELGLGSGKVDGKSPVDVKRPRLNNNLSASTVGVVQIAVGGMHCAALTKDNKILTWGVNDQGALGRDTKWDGGLKDLEDDGLSDVSSEDSGMNPNESTPTAISDEHFPAGTKFIQVAASDSATFAVTADGSVYGWGTFRSNEGILGFTGKIYVQTTPIKIPELKKIKSIAAGANHVLALDHKGNVFAWGSGQQNQLGRRIVERTRMGGLVPREFGLPRNKIASIASGAYHSFAIDTKGQVWAWGLNNFGETGIVEGSGEDHAVIPVPTIVKELKEYDIKEIQGGGHHSLACTTDGTLLVWGRADSSQLGIKIQDLPKEDVIFDERGAARILSKPTIIPDLNVTSVAAGSENSFAITTDGKAYSWGFSANYQTGQGTDEEVKVVTLIDNTAVRGKKLTFAGAGGQFSVLAGPAEDTAMENGV